MTNKHTHRRGLISAQNNSVRDKLRQIAFSRTHANFSQFLSDGPYTGVHVVEQGQHQDNGDEASVAGFAGNFSKGLAHDPTTGLPVPAEYTAFKQTLDAQATSGLTQLPISGSLAAIDSFPNGGGGARARSFVNPLSGVGSDVYGLDTYDMAIPPAPALGSDVAAKEMVELYWMAVVRDVHFANWSTNTDVQHAMQELNSLNNTGNSFAQHYINGMWSKTVDNTTIFRGSAPGNNVGEYVSQFLVHDIQYGTLKIKQRQRPVPVQDHMRTGKNG